MFDRTEYDSVDTNSFCSVFNSYLLKKYFNAVFHGKYSVSKISAGGFMLCMKWWYELYILMKIFIAFFSKFTRTLLETYCFFFVFLWFQTFNVQFFQKIGIVLSPIYLKHFFTLKVLIKQTKRSRDIWYLFQVIFLFLITNWNFRKPHVWFLEVFRR